MSQEIKEALLFGVLATLLMTATGAVIIPLAKDWSPIWQNLTYTIGRFPIIAVAYYAFNEVLQCKKK